MKTRQYRHSQSRQRKAQHLTHQMERKDSTMKKITAILFALCLALTSCLALADEAV